MKLTNIILFSAIIIIGALLYYKKDNLTITHAHGLAVDTTDPNRVYIATHEGLLTLNNNGDLYAIGDVKDDLMGFSVHPTNPNVFFSSGHPHRGGGNLGFQKSYDGGLTWEKVSPGNNGPVDFHAMAVNPINPDLIYGWYMNALQRSRDGGKTWETVPSNLTQVLSLVADQTTENTIYATTTNGIQISTDEGLTWNSLTEEPLGAVSALAINPQETKTMLSFSQHHGLSKSTDGGKSWQILNPLSENSPVTFIAYSKNNAEKVYALTHNNELYNSNDGGTTWSKIK